MHWIALLPSHEDERTAWGWRALQFTPRVAWVDEALLLEASACAAVGWPQGLLPRLLRIPAPGARAMGAGPHRLVGSGLAAPASARRIPAGASAARSSARCADRGAGACPTLARIGCRTWGDVAALPRGGLTRRFGAQLARGARCRLWGRGPSAIAWLTLPDVFDQKLELPALADHRARAHVVGQPPALAAADLAARPPARRAGARTAMDARPRALQRRATCRRTSSSPCAPPSPRRTWRTCAAWCRAAGAHHARRARELAAAALARNHPWAGASTSFLPEDNRKGDKLHELVERLSARLGAQQVLVPHGAGRPPARAHAGMAARAATSATLTRAAAELAEPRRVAKPRNSQRSRRCDLPAVAAARSPCALEMRGEHPHYQGRCAGWPARSGWRPAGGAAVKTGPARVRDYYVARESRPAWSGSSASGLRPLASDEVRWFLQGLYA